MYINLFGGFQWTIAKLMRNFNLLKRCNRERNKLMDTINENTPNTKWTWTKSNKTSYHTTCNFILINATVLQRTWTIQIYQCSEHVAARKMLVSVSILENIKQKLAIICMIWSQPIHATRAMHIAWRHSCCWFLKNSEHW